MSTLRTVATCGVFSVALLTSGTNATLQAQDVAGSQRELHTDTWVATDALGRTLPTAAECGAPRADKFVGIFYWTWHVPRPGPYDNSKLIPKADGESVPWQSNVTDAHHWGEPELGYYRMTDPFVIRKHASMLADAGVDVVLFDTTNPPLTWKNEYEALCRVYSEMREAGERTPAIAFIGPFGDPRPVTDQLWRDLYKPGNWSDLWFRWEGKPLLLADKGFIKDPEMLEFFTFRRPMPDYWIGQTGPDQWSWLEVHPQHPFTNAAGLSEQMSVGVAQNALPATPGPAPMSHKAGAMGRSWHGGKKDLRAEAVLQGLNFQEQWDHALKTDPKFVFVTGWNEWIAGRYLEWSKYKDSDCYFPGGLFVDQYTQEYSRDCEPMRGGHTDNYYYQLVSNIRKYKGVRPCPEADGPSAVEIDGTFGDWERIGPEFRDTVGDTKHRNHPGYGSLVYTNQTGRNDFSVLKAAYDRTNLYFHARTVAPISPRTGQNWMLLFLDADQDAKTGWLGYDYLINAEVPGEDQTTVKKWQDGGWKKIGISQYRVAGEALELSVARALVGVEEDAPEFDFHWADNIQVFGDPAEFGLNGDSAPNRRFNYRFKLAR